MNSTQRVVENHIQRFREGDLDGVLEDFSPEAVVFTPSGTLKGKSEIKTLFQNMLEEFGKAGASETVRTAIFEGDYAYLIWSGETVDNNYEFATDTFVLFTFLRLSHRSRVGCHVFIGFLKHILTYINPNGDHSCALRRQNKMNSGTYSMAR
jgi:hypothetical protein